MFFEISGVWLWSVSHCWLFARCEAVFQAALIVKGWRFFVYFLEFKHEFKRTADVDVPQ